MLCSSRASAWGSYVCWRYKYLTPRPVCVCVSLQGCTFPAVMRTVTTGKCSVTRAEGSAGASTSMVERWWEPESMATPTAVREGHLASAYFFTLCTARKSPSYKVILCLCPVWKAVLILFLYFGALACSFQITNKKLLKTDRLYFFFFFWRFLIILIKEAVTNKEKKKKKRTDGDFWRCLK